MNNISRLIGMSFFIFATQLSPAGIASKVKPPPAPMGTHSVLTAETPNFDRVINEIDTRETLVRFFNHNSTFETVTRSTFSKGGYFTFITLRDKNDPKKDRIFACLSVSRLPTHCSNRSCDPRLPIYTFRLLSSTTEKPFVLPPIKK